MAAISIRLFAISKSEGGTYGYREIHYKLKSIQVEVYGQLDDSIGGHCKTIFVQQGERSQVPGRCNWID